MKKLEELIKSEEYAKHCQKVRNLVGGKRIENILFERWNVELRVVFAWEGGPNPVVILERIEPNSLEDKNPGLMSLLDELVNELIDSVLLGSDELPTIVREHMKETIQDSLHYQKVQEEIDDLNEQQGKWEDEYEDFDPEYEIFDNIKHYYTDVDSYEDLFIVA